MSASSSTSQPTPKRNRNGRSGGDSSRDIVTVSKAFSKVLRHQAVNLGLTMSKDGFVALNDILALKGFAGVTLEIVESIVENNNKKRFELVLVEGAPEGSRNAGDYKIRAVQGHSISMVEDDLLLEELTATNIDELLPQSIVFHGTYRQALPAILKSGLNRMSRNHIHLAIGLPQDGAVISGLRNSAEIAIVIDVKKAQRAGVQFLISKNKVVLSKGLNGNGVIPQELFEDVIALDGKSLDLENIE